MKESLNKVFDVYIFALSFFFASRPLNDPDFWFHLKTGEYIFQYGAIPRTDLFSFTHYGRPWVAHGWLSGAAFYAFYSRLGFNFLIFLFALLAALAFWIVYKRCNSPPIIAGGATLLGAWSVTTTLGVRPRIFSLLIASIYLAVLNQYAKRGTGRRVWLLIPLMTLWVNLHGGFFIGFALIALTLLGIPLDAWTAGDKLRSVWPQIRVLALIFLGCLGAGLLNPYGVRMYTFPISVLQSPIFQDLINDWLSPNFHQPELRALLLLILLTISVLLLAPRRIKPSELLLFVAVFYATLKAQRNMLIFPLVAVPLLAVGFQELLSKYFGRTTLGRASVTMSSAREFTLMVVLILPLGILAVRARSALYVPLTQQKSHVPIKAVNYLKENQITGNTFAAPNVWGGYLLWALPSNPVYIDGRDVYPDQFVKEFVEIGSGTVDWKKPFERHSVQIAVIQPNTNLALRLEESTTWERIYQDEMSVVFRKRH
ncbi:MAG: hypothetical protein ACR2H6_02010 [Pyrinomonadaceae bacterium]